MPQDYVFKFITMGVHGVGKSSILTQFLGEEFSWSHAYTVDLRFEPQIISIDYKPDIKFKLRIWDMGRYNEWIDKVGGAGFLSGIPRSPRFPYKGVVGALLFYDVSRRETFDDLASWVEVLRQHGNANMIITLVGNTCDLADERVVSAEEGEQFAKEHDLLFLETSAKTAQNIQEIFTKAAVTLYKKIQDKEAFIRTVSTVYEKIQDEEKPKRSLQNLGKEIEKLQKEKRELKDTVKVKQRDELIRKMLKGCKAFLPKKDESEQVAKSVNRGVDILGQGATITNTTYGDEY